MNSQFIILVTYIFNIEPPSIIVNAETFSKKRLSNFFLFCKKSFGTKDNK